MSVHVQLRMKLSSKYYIRHQIALDIRTNQIVKQMFSREQILVIRLSIRLDIGY